MGDSCDSGFEDLRDNRQEGADSNMSGYESSDELYTEVESPRMAKKIALNKTKRLMLFFPCMRKPVRISEKNSVANRGNDYETFRKDYHGLKPKLPPLDTLPSASRSQSNGSHCTQFDKSTQVPEVEVTLESQNRDKEGSIHLSLTNPHTEDQLLLYCKQEQDKFATLFETYGFTLLSIEKGSIVFKFKLESQDCTLECLQAGRKLKHLMVDIVNSLPGLDGQKSVVIEVEFSSMQKVKCDIAASAVQIGDSNQAFQQGIAETSDNSTAPKITGSPQNDVNQNHRRTSKSPYQNLEDAEKHAKEVDADISGGEQNKVQKEAFENQLNALSIEESSQHDKAGSASEENTAPGGSFGNALNMTKLERSENGPIYAIDNLSDNAPNEHKIENGDDDLEGCNGKVDAYIHPLGYPPVYGGNQTPVYWSHPPLCQNDSGYGSGSKTDTGSQHEYDAIIIVRTSNTDSMQLISDELSALKTVSSLEFDTPHNSSQCEVTVPIKTRRIILNQFYDLLVAFLTYPHLLKVITSGSTLLTLKIKSDCEYQKVCTPEDDAVLIFEGHDAIGLQEVVRELECMKSVSLTAMRYNTVCTDTVHKVSVHMRRERETDEEFLSRVLRFPSFYHLMSTVVKHKIDLSIGVLFKGDKSEHLPVFHSLKRFLRKKEKPAESAK